MNLWARLRGRVGGARGTLTKSRIDHGDSLRCQLRALRASESYGPTFENPRPLISVVIVTNDASDLCMTRAVDSVRHQTYSHWEIIIVGCDRVSGLAEQVEQLGDARVRLLDLQCGDKGLIDPCVSGSAAYGHAVNEARGEWIAPLGSDDEFLPHHLERLLAVALERNAELAYGKLERVGPTGAARYMYAFPPERGRVAAEQAIYLRTLSSFAHDPCARVPAEPGEWTVIDRMWAAGVRVAGIDELVTRSYSSTAKSQSGDPEVNLRFRSGSGDRQTVRVSMTGAKRHDSAKVWARCDTLEIRTGNAPWAYAAVVPLPELGVVPLAIRATIVVSAGRVGVALLRVSDEIAVEFFLDEQQDDQVIELPVREPDGVWRFLVRNHAFPGPSRCTLRRLECIVEGSDERLQVAD